MILSKKNNKNMKIKNYLLILDHNICSSWCIKNGRRIKWRNIKNCDPHMGYYMWYRKTN